MSENVASLTDEGETPSASLVPDVVPAVLALVNMN